jgi:hypothetical protein
VDWSCAPLAVLVPPALAVRREPQNGTPGRMISRITANPQDNFTKLWRNFHLWRGPADLALLSTPAFFTYSVSLQMVIRMPCSVARARGVSTGRSFRSSAIGPPASKVMPLTPPFLFWSFFSVARQRDACQPAHALFWRAGYRSVTGHLRASPPIQPRRKVQPQPRASQMQKCLRPVRRRQGRESVQPDRSED